MKTIRISHLPRAWTSTVTACLIGLLLAGCSAYTPQAGPRQGGTLVVGLGEEPVSLNPLVAGDQWSVRAYTPLFPLLYELTADGTVLPSLAAALPQVDADQRTWHVPIRPHAHWSDGAAMDASDVVYTVNTERDPLLDTRATFDWSVLESVSADGPGTVTFRLRRPWAPFLADSLVMPVVPRHVLAEVAPAKMAADPFSTVPTVTGGPFHLRARVPIDRNGDRTRLDMIPDPHWFGTPPRLALLSISSLRGLGESSTAVASGQALWAPGLDEGAAVNVRGAASVHVVSYPEQGGVALVFNARTGRLFADATLRQATSHLLDPPAVAGRAAGAEGVAVPGFVNPASWAYSRPAGRAVRDRRGAEALLSGRSVRSELLYPAGDAMRERAAVEIAAEVRGTGLDLVPSAQAPGIFDSRLRQGEFEVALGGFALGPDPDPADPNGPVVSSGWSDPRAAALLARDLAVSDLSSGGHAARTATIHEAEGVLIDAAPAIWLWAASGLTVLNESIGAATAVGMQYDHDRANSFLAEWYLRA